MILCVCPNPSIDKFVWIDDFKPGQINRTRREQVFPGGKGVHVALGIAELGEETAILGFWGGHTGKYINEYCESKGISCFGPEIDEPNRTCLNFRSNGDLNGTEVLEAGPFIDDEVAYLFWLEYTRLLDMASVVCLSGSWPLTSATTEIGYGEFTVAAKKKAIRAFVDCSGKSLVDVLPARPHCIHINNLEGLDVFHEESPLKIANTLLQNCEVAAVTAGEEGLYLVSKGHSPLHANCKLDQIISPVGSGDSLMAGLVVAHKRGLNFDETAKLATACGAANCIREELGMFIRKMLTG